MGDQHESRRVKLSQPMHERGPWAGEIGLGQEQTVSDRRLFCRNLLAIERLGAVHGVDGGHDPTQDHSLGNRRIRHEGLQHRRRISKPAGLDHNT
jgi:hypothetical protein